MKSKILLVGFLAAMLTSCTAYKAGQTPDDVYYSPAKAAKERTETYSRRADRYEDYVSHEDDRYLRMKTRNRERWSTIDDYDYWYDSRYVPSYSYNYYRNNWNSLYLNNWNTGYYQPYNYGVYGYNNWSTYPGYYNNGYSRYGYNGYGSGSFSKPPVYISKRPVEVSRPELNSYNNRSYNNRNSLGNTIMKAFTPSNSESGYSNSNSRTYSGNNTSSSSERTYSAPERTYTPSSSSGSSSNSSSGSSGGGVSRPARNGGN
ncbi:MAG: hypothetical protein H0X70_01500 [Segetibacter sp.]|nr:hypothetical protein [Segetibacter sp.]